MRKKIPDRASRFRDGREDLDPLQDNSFDLVFAQYNFSYYEDLPTAFANWYRVLRNGGRLFIGEFHPVTACVKEEDGKVVITRDYYDKTPEYYAFDGTGHVPGYQSDLQNVEFPYTLSDQINASPVTLFFSDFTPT